MSVGDKSSVSERSGVVGGGRGADGECGILDGVVAGGGERPDEAVYSGLGRSKSYQTWLVVGRNG